MQFLVGARREGKLFWRTFWIGGTLEQYGTHSLPAARGQRSTTGEIVAAMELRNVPWNLATSAALGLWLMVAPTVLGLGGAAADNHHLVGALVVTWAVIAFGEVARTVRLLNIVMGIWIAVSPWLLSGTTDVSRWADLVTGGVLVALSVRRGRVDERFGAWNRYLI
jgi:hypothetical protein